MLHSLIANLIVYIVQQTEQVRMTHTHTTHHSTIPLNSITYMRGPSCSVASRAPGPRSDASFPHRQTDCLHSSTNKAGENATHKPHTTPPFHSSSITYSRGSSCSVASRAPGPRSDASFPHRQSHSLHSSTHRAGENATHTQTTHHSTIPLTSITYQP
jgi:hypothetical protein